MFGLVRLIKPRLVVETGCYLGHTTVHLAQGLKANQLGCLYGCDLDEAKVQLVQDKLKADNLPGTILCCSGLDLVKKFDWVSLAFIDTGDNQTRFEELKALRLAPSAFVALHDSRRKLGDYVELNLRWKQLFFPTPRGLSIYATR